MTIRRGSARSVLEHIARQERLLEAGGYVVAINPPITLSRPHQSAVFVYSICASCRRPVELCWCDHRGDGMQMLRPVRW